MKVVTEAQLERHRPSEGKCKSHHHPGLFLRGSGSVEVTPVSVRIEKDHNVFTAPAKLSHVSSIVILFIFFNLISSGWYKLGRMDRKIENIAVFFFSSRLLVGTCSATGAASPDSLSENEPQKES